MSNYSKPHPVPELWWWINKTERKFGGFGNSIPDNYCKQLIKKLKKVLPYLKEFGKESDKFIFEDDFDWIGSLEEKFFISETHMRGMDFDFVKGIIHKNLILRSHILNKPEFWNYRPPYYITGRDDVLRDSRTGKRV